MEVTSISEYILKTDRLPVFDQIELHLLHSKTTPGVVTGHFELLNKGQTVFTNQRGGFGQSYGTETPDYSEDDELATRVRVVASARPEFFGI